MHRSSVLGCELQSREADTHGKNDTHEDGEEEVLETGLIERRLPERETWRPRPRVSTILHQDTSKSHAPIKRPAITFKPILAPTSARRPRGQSRTDNASRYSTETHR